MTLDPDAIENIRSLGGADPDGFLREIVGIFLTDTPGRLREMRLAVDENNSAVFSRAAHSIKGSSANLGAVALKHAAEKAEVACRADWTQAPLVLAELNGEFEHTRQALQALPAVRVTQP